MIRRIPGVPVPIKKSSANSFADSPFVDAISMVEMPRKFNLLAMRMYDGTTDPDDHVAQYKQRMFTAANLANYEKPACVRGSVIVCQDRPYNGI